MTDPVPVWPREPLLAKQVDGYWWVDVPLPHPMLGALDEQRAAAAKGA